MVYTIPGRNAPNASFGNQLGQNISEGFLKSAQPAIQQQYQRGQLQKGLEQLRQRGQDPNASPTDLLYNLIEASSYSPEIGRNLPQLYEQLNKAREAQAMQKVNYGGQGEQQMQPGGISAPSPQQNPQVQQALQQQHRNFPNNLKGNEAPGNLPQESTKGQIRPILDGQEKMQEAQKLQAEWGRKGIIKTFDEAYAQVERMNNANESYNQQLNAETERRVAAQEKYGAVAEERLTKVLPGATDEEKAIFKKIGEEAAGRDRSTGSIDGYITKEVNDYKNSISNIQKDLEAPRIQGAISRSFSGKSGDIEKAMSDARQAIQPLLKKGLVDKSRSMLSQAGFAPEERENIVFGPLPKETRSQIDKIPSAVSVRTPIKQQGSFPVGKAAQKEYSVKSKMHLYESLTDLFEQGHNDSLNLLQIRKAYEDKGYDWRMFKDSLNDLKNSGHITLNPDQENQFNSYLNNPPLDTLGKVLHGLNFIGR